MPKSNVHLINIRDYPRNSYSAYWEIRVDGANDIGYSWGVRLYDYETSKMVKESQGGTMTRNEADTEAQTWVINQMSNYRKGEV